MRMEFYRGKTMIDKKALTLHIAGRFYRFLFATCKAEVITLAGSMDFLIPGGRNIQEVSNAIQRHLYYLARQHGWRKKRRKEADGRTVFVWVKD